MTDVGLVRRIEDVKREELRDRLLFGRLGHPLAIHQREAALWIRQASAIDILHGHIKQEEFTLAIAETETAEAVRLVRHIEAVTQIRLPLFAILGEVDLLKCAWGGATEPVRPCEGLVGIKHLLALRGTDENRALLDATEDLADTAHETLEGIGRRVAVLARQFHLNLIGGRGGHDLLIAKAPLPLVSAARIVFRGADNGEIIANPVALKGPAANHAKRLGNTRPLVHQFLYRSVIGGEGDLAPVLHADAILVQIHIRSGGRAVLDLCPIGFAGHNIITTIGLNNTEAGEAETDVLARQDNEAVLLRKGRIALGTQAFRNGEEGGGVYHALVTECGLQLIVGVFHPFCNLCLDGLHLCGIEFHSTRRFLISTIGFPLGGR